MIALSAQTSEAIDSIHTGSAIVAGVDGTFIDIDVAHFPCVSRFAGTLVPIYLVDASPEITGIALTVIQVDLTVSSCSSFGADTQVGILTVLAGASVLAWLTETLINVDLAQTAHETRTADAGEGRQAIFTGAVVTRVGQTLIYICLTVLPCVSFSALAGVHIGPIHTLGPIFTRSTSALVNVELALAPRKSCGALALVVVDLVDALPIVEAGHAGALIGIDLTEDSLVPWHTDAMESSNLI